MANLPPTPPNSEILLYQTEDGRTRIHDRISSRGIGRSLQRASTNGSTIRKSHNK